MKTQGIFKFGLAVSMAVLLLAGPATRADVIYVIPGQDIQAAIDGAALTGDEIEVAPGTYHETINFLSKAIRLYSSGGPGVTTINGAGNLHVVQCILGEGADTILEGFTITGGNANGATDPAKRGGGMYNNSSSPTVTNCIFTGNSAVDGGAMYNINSNPVVSDCVFTTNTATHDGGGIYNNNSSPTVSGCDFDKNTAPNAGRGGGIYSSGGSPSLDDCAFTANTASQAGGGMFNNYSNATITHCTYTNNTTGVDGGGMNSYGGSSTITNCIFSGNGAQYGAGMYNTYSASPIVTNCVFANNSASACGGGMLNQTGAMPTLIHCTFSGNSNYGVCNYGSEGASQVTATNCILWGDTSGEIVNNGGSATVTYSDVQGGYDGAGNIDGDPLFLDAAGGDFRFLSSVSPCVDTGNNGAATEATDLAGNPRIVDGDLDGTPTVDMGAFELQPRPIHNITQDSWYETIQTAINDAVTADQIEVGPGTYPEAINFRGKAIELYSSGGAEVTTIDASGLNASVVTCRSSEGAATVLEGFTITGGSGTIISAMTFGGGMYNSSSSPTVTDCIFVANSASQDGGGMNNTNSSPVVTGCTFDMNSASWGGGMYNTKNSSPVITGCTFVSNNASSQCGGGMMNYYVTGNPIVKNCTFRSNTAGINGGGMYNDNSSNLTITDCTFDNNAANNSGGGMYNNNSILTITNCTFDNNTAINDGGGMVNYASSPAVSYCTFRYNWTHENGSGGGIFNQENSNPTLNNCTFYQNAATHGGGGMLNYNNSKPTLTNCIFNQNSALQGSGGAMRNYNGCHAVLKNCTFRGNQGSHGGGGILNFNSSPTVTNCIFWGNQPDQIDNATSSPVISYCDIENGYSGTGNIDADPNFVDASNPDPNLVNLRLRPGSPCIDAGNTAAVTAGVFVDMGGKPRVLDDPASPDTGIAGLEVTVDMGAYEFTPCALEGDIDCDGIVNLLDLCILAEHWLQSTGG